VESIVDGSTAVAFKAGVKSKTYQDQYPECTSENPNRPLGNLALDELALYNSVDFDTQMGAGGESTASECSSSSSAVRFVESGRMFWELEKCFKPCDSPHRRINEEGIAQKNMIHV